MQDHGDEFILRPNSPLPPSSDATIGTPARLAVAGTMKLPDEFGPAGGATAAARASSSAPVRPLRAGARWCRRAGLSSLLAKANTLPVGSLQRLPRDTKTLHFYLLADQRRRLPACTAIPASSHCSPRERTLERDRPPGRTRMGNHRRVEPAVQRGSHYARIRCRFPAPHTANEAVANILGSPPFTPTA